MVAMVVVMMGTLVAAAAVADRTGHHVGHVALTLLGALGGICHDVAYASLLIWFGQSLRPGHEPVVTGFARQLRQTMPDKVVRYTRKVTYAWCAFFAAQLALSAILPLTAPIAAWSAFVPLLSLPLLVAMILAEFGVRMILFRHEPHTGLIASVLAVRRVRFAPASRQ